MHLELFLGSDTHRRGHALAQRRLEWSDEIDPIDIEVFDLSDPTQIPLAITAIRIGPLFSPARLVVWRHAEPLLKAKPQRQGELEEAIAGAADDLILLAEFKTSAAKGKDKKPPALITASKRFQQLLRGAGATTVFDAPAPWDNAAAIAMVREMAQAIDLKLSSDHSGTLLEMVGTDSARIQAELTKLKALTNAGTAITTATMRRSIDGDHADLAALHTAVLNGDSTKALAMVRQLEVSGIKTWQTISKLQTLALQTLLLSQCTDNAAVAQWLRTSPGAIYFRRKELPRRPGVKAQATALLAEATTLATLVGEGAPLQPGDALKRYVAAGA